MPASADGWSASDIGRRPGVSQVSLQGEPPTPS